VKHLSFRLANDLYHSLGHIRKEVDRRFLAVNGDLDFEGLDRRWLFRTFVEQEMRAADLIVSYHNLHLAIVKVCNGASVMMKIFIARNGNLSYASGDWHPQIKRLLDISGLG